MTKPSAERPWERVRPIPDRGPADHPRIAMEADRKQIKPKRMKRERDDATARNGSGRKVSHEQHNATGWDSGP